jgi:hypothetical protein
MGIQPLPENIGFFSGRSIARRWLGWMRTIHRLAETSIDVEVLQAFTDLNRVDLKPLEDQAALSALDQPSEKASDPSVDHLLATIGAADRPIDVSLLEFLAALIAPAREWSEIRVIQDTAANASLYPAAAYVQGSVRRETDSQKVFLQLAGAWVQVIAPAFLPFLLAAATHGALKLDGAGLVVRVGDDTADSFLKVLDEVYDATNWNTKTEVPTKNAVRDKFEQLAPGLTDALVDDAAYDAGWDADISHAPSRNAVYDKVETKADAQAPGAHTITLAKITGLGTDGSLIWNAQGVITGFVDPT